MKKRFITIVLFTLFLLMSGCSTSEDVHENNFSAVESSSNNADQLTQKLYVPEADVEFLDFINDNPIDTAYHHEFPDTGITGQMASVEEKYADIWKTEMEYSLNNLAKFLTEEDSKHLLELQKGWENSVIGTITFEQEQLLTDSYNVSLGSMYTYTKISAYLDAYRDRTIHLKYLQYIIERAEKPNLPLKEFSLNFYYNS